MVKDKTMTNLIKNSTIYALGDILPRLLSFITFPILTNYLTPAEYGIINYVNTLNLFLIIVSVLCLNTYYLVYFYKQPNEEHQKQLLGNLSLFILISTTIISIITFIIGFYTNILNSEGMPFFPYITIGILINFFSIFQILPSALYRLQERPLPLTIINIIKGILTASITLFLVIFHSYKALGVLMSSLIVNILFAFIFLYITYKHAIFNFNFKQIKNALKFSLPLLPGSIAYYLLNMSDRIIIKDILDLNSLGIYSTASTLALLLNIITMGAYKAFEPYIFKIYGNPSFEMQFKKIFNTYLFVLIIGASALALFSREFFIIFSSEKFHEAYKYVPVILIGLISSSISIIYGTVITARERTKISSLISIIGGCCSVVLNIILVPLIGIWGACTSSLICFTAMAYASYYFSKVRFDTNNIIKYILLIILIWYFAIFIINIEIITISIIVKTVIFSVIIVTYNFLLKINIKQYIWKNI